MPTVSVRMPKDCHEALRVDAFYANASITQILAKIVRKHYDLPRASESAGQADSPKVGAA